MTRILAVALLLFAAVSAMGQEAPPRTAFAVADLELLSYEALPDGTVAQSGPLCAAIVMAWLAHHGYPGLLPDLNGDGKVNEEDTLLLASRFAREMSVRPDQPALDPKLMDVVARYVGEKYPKEFALKIWDDTFATEYQAAFGKVFSPSDYPKIEVRLLPNASHSDYVGELGAGEGVIVGLGKEKGTNTFFVGRSFELAEKAAGWPVDFVDTSDDPFQPGVQGQVFATEMQKGPDHWLVRYAGWTPLEFMLSLSPIRRPGTGTPPGPCPTGALGYDVTTVNSEWGTFKVEECVIRKGEVDLYSYRVTNISFLYNNCGICEFYVPNVHGLSTLAQWGPESWFVNPWGLSWSWMAPLGDCGILPGETAEFGFAVPAPTTDTSQGAGIGACFKGGLVGPAGPAVIEVPWVKFQTTGPKPGEEVGCPDLKVVDLYACWRYTPRQEIEVVVTVIVQNIGTAASGSFWVCLEAGGASDLEPSMSLAPGATVTITATFALGSPAGLPGFPIPVKAFADCMYQVKECDEYNNEASFLVGKANNCK